ncbi:MAG: S41 family peptidase [Chloroflexota bacterium]
MKLPEASGDDDAMQAYINAGQLIIEKQASAYGWIVDLRENNGGNMWAMLTSIGAIVGERIYGYFVNRERELFHWGYKDSASFYENDIVYTANNPAQLVSDDYPLAVLVSNWTASSGEITLIACLSHPRVRVFGNPTAGIPTANDLFKLDDNTTLVLTSFVTMDTRGNVHETSIIPDVVCTNPLVMAQKWLEVMTHGN